MLYNSNLPAFEFVDLKSDISPNQEFNRDTLHLFCSPLFLKAMCALYDKNIQTISCGSGKERGILPGITCNYDTLSNRNKVIANDMIISPSQFRIGVEILKNTTFAEFENRLMAIIDKFEKQE